MPSAALLLPFGFHVPTQRLIAIEAVAEAQRGAGCDCVCPGCRAPLLAKFPRSESGPTRHFAHAPGSHCVAPETLLHKTAKILVAQERRLWLPERPGKPAHRQEFDTGVTEYPFGPPPPNSYVADAMLTLQGRQLLVEIVVTHDLDEPKHRYVVDNKLHMVRVDLSTFPREFSLPGLRQRLIAPYPGLSHWIFPVTAARPVLRSPPPPPAPEPPAPVLDPRPAPLPRRRRPEIETLGIVAHFAPDGRASQRVDHCPLRWRRLAEPAFPSPNLCEQCEFFVEWRRAGIACRGNSSLGYDPTDDPNDPNRFPF